MSPLNQGGVIYREYPERSQVITALNASDVAVLPNRKNNFSEYCFPYKLMEYIVIGLPIVSTRIGDASSILSKFGYLCKANDKYDMTEKLIYALKTNKKPNYKSLLKNLRWERLSKKINNIILKKNKNGGVN